MPAALKWISSTLVVAGALTALPMACNSTEEAILAALGGGCLLSSDCEDGLVCVFRRCHEPCNTSVDCPLDSDGEHERCMLGEKPNHYCQLGDETACVYNSECPGAQICGRDGECRDQCETDKDCVEDQRCAQASCALAEELNEEGELPLVSDPDVVTGQSCVHDSECAAASAELVCLAGACNYECKGDVDCESHVCEIPAGAPGGRCAPSSVICVPGVQVACDCLGGGIGAQICKPDGTGYDVCKDVNGSCAPP
ncbi:MAG: hypothetical protein R3B72_29690 [Polyangiaceae bacterium]